jgi:uncharacterized protein
MMDRVAPFIDSRLFVRWVEDLGYGVFAKEDIANQDFLEIAPAIVFEPPEKTDDNLMNYVIAWEGKLAVSLGWTMLYNHSDDNNCVFSVNHQNKLVAIVAIRDISAGEQLTVNYGPDWFSSRKAKKIKP